MNRRLHVPCFSGKKHKLPKAPVNEVIENGMSESNEKHKVKHTTDEVNQDQRAMPIGLSSVQVREKLGRMFKSICLLVYVCGPLKNHPSLHAYRHGTTLHLRLGWTPAFSRKWRSFLSSLSASKCRQSTRSFMLTCIFNFSELDFQLELSQS